MDNWWLPLSFPTLFLLFVCLKLSLTLDLALADWLAKLAK